MVSLKSLLFFGGGVAVGLWLAKQYVKQSVHDEIHEGLSKIGLEDGPLENVIQGLGQYITG